MLGARSCINSSFFPNHALNSGILTQMAWLGIFSCTIVPNSYAATGIRTHIVRVEPDWGGIFDGRSTD